MVGRSARVLLTAGLLLSALGVPHTLGYIDQSQVRVSLSAPNVVRCDRSATISARVISRRNGKPVRNQVVRWSLARSASDRDGLSATSTVTDRRGRTSIIMRFGPAAGSRTVTAGATNTSPSVTVRCAGGLPKTSPRPPLGYSEQPSEILLPVVDVRSNARSIPVRTLRLDRLGIDLPVVEGDGQTVPEGSASHYPGTAWPGEGSNTYIYAHARQGDFLELWQVRTGDLVSVEMSDGRELDYRVSEVVPLAHWDAFEFLEPTASERLTLQTSLWYHDTAPRFIVIAEPVTRV
jgi:LPXTG-site transpeptidase (sortase) family protein